MILNQKTHLSNLTRTKFPKRSNKRRLVLKKINPSRKKRFLWKYQRKNRKNSKDPHLSLKMTMKWENIYLTLKTSLNYHNLKTTYQLRKINRDLRNKVNLSQIRTHLKRIKFLLIKIHKFFRIFWWFLLSSLSVLISKMDLFSNLSLEKNLKRDFHKSILLMNITLSQMEKNWPKSDFKFLIICSFLTKRITMFKWVISSFNNTLKKMLKKWYLFSNKPTTYFVSRLLLNYMTFLKSCVILL